MTTSQNLTVCIGCGDDIPTDQVEIVADSKGTLYARCIDDRDCSDRYSEQTDDVKRMLRRNANRRPPGELVPVEKETAR